MFSTSSGGCWRSMGGGGIAGPEKRPSRRSGALSSRKPQPNARANRLPDSDRKWLWPSNSKSRVNTETRVLRLSAGRPLRNTRLGRAKAPDERKASVERVPTISPRRHTRTLPSCSTAVVTNRHETADPQALSFFCERLIFDFVQTEKIILYGLF